MRTNEGTSTEALMEQLIETGPEDMAAVFAGLFNLAMRIERERFLGAGHYERTPGRRGYANGTRPKKIDTPAGTVTLQVPKTADHDEPFYPQALGHGLESLSSSQVSRAAKLLDEELEAWRRRTRAPRKRDCWKGQQR